jgi:hypothetical protein
MKWVLTTLYKARRLLGYNANCTPGGGTMNFFRAAWGWLRHQIIEDVPVDSATCEFNCRQSHCQDGEWDICERRVQGAAQLSLPLQGPDSPVGGSQGS